MATIAAMLLARLDKFYECAWRFAEEDYAKACLANVTKGARRLPVDLRFLRFWRDSRRPDLVSPYRSPRRAVRTPQVEPGRMRHGRKKRVK